MTWLAMGSGHAVIVITGLLAWAALIGLSRHRRRQRDEPRHRKRRLRTAACCGLIRVVTWAAGPLWPPLPKRPSVTDMAHHPGIRMTGPVPRDGEPLAADEAVALAAILYSIRHEDAAEPSYRRQP